MNPTHLSRAELYEEIERLKKELAFYKKKTDEHDSSMTRLMNELHRK